MNKNQHNTGQNWLKKISFFMVMFFCTTVLNAQVTVTKSELNGLTSKQVNQPFTYVINYSTPNTSTSYTNLRICDQLPQGLVFLGVSPATGDMQSLSYNSSTNSVCAVFNSPWNGGTGQFQIVVKFDQHVFNGTVASNTATVSSDQYNGTSNTVNITAISGNTPPTLKTGCTIEMYGPPTLANKAAATYTMAYGIGGLNPVSSYTVINTLPTGFVLGNLANGQFFGTNVNYNVYYKTNTNASWVAFPIMTYNTASYVQIFPPSFPSGTYITQIKIEYPSLPAGTLFTRENFAGMALVGYYDATIAGSVNTNGTTFTDCVSATTTGAGAGTCGPTCYTTTYTTQQAYTTHIAKHTTTWVNDVEAGGTYRYAIEFGEGTGNTQDVVNPVIAELLPPEFIYVGNPTYHDGDNTNQYTNAGSPLPKVDIIPNFAGTGRTLVRWSWDAAHPFTLHRSGAFLNSIVAEFDVQIRSVPTGTYQNDAYGSASGATPDDCQTFYYPVTSILDVNDIDGDGSTTDYVCSTFLPVNIVNPSGAALVSEKWVKGSLDAGYSRYPASGKTTPGGMADYKLKLKNAGTVALKNIKVIDIFPYVGDRGVIDLSARGSQWQPMFVGPVTGPAGSTVYYSTSYDPCRTDINFTAPGCDAGAVWTTTIPSDITTVHSIKLDLGSIVIQPGDSLEFNWPMRAPIDAPTNGEIAWNSFGYTATRNDNNSVLPSSEPIKVGISVNPIQPAAYGNYVWYDANGDGLQNEPAANGINGVKVDLYWAKGATPNIATDSLVTFTITSSNAGNPGYYLFPVLNPGNYYAVFHKPLNNLSITTPNVGSDNTINSDGIQTIISGDTLAITAITNLTAGETDYTWDLGLSPACTKPNAGVNQNSCPGTSVTLTGSPTTGTWSAQAGNPAGATLGSTTAGSASVTFNNTATGTYNFIYTTGTSCTDTMSVVVSGSIPTAPTCSTVSVCEGLDATVAVTAAVSPVGGTITWNTGNATTATSYTYAITTSCGTASCTNTITRVKATVGNYVWSDLNNDGLQNDGVASGLNGVTVQLWDNVTSTLVATTTTANDGSGNPGYYSFSVCNASTYYIKFPTTYGGMPLTTTNVSAGVDGNNDAAGVNGLSVPFTLDPNGTSIQQNNPTIDAGYLTCVKPNAGSDITACGGVCVNITGTANTGSWTAMSSNPVGATLGTTTLGVANVCFATTASGSYSFIYSVGTNCSDTMTVTVSPKPVAGADQMICGGNCATISGTANTGSWTAMSSNAAGATLSTTTAGVATVCFATTASGNYSFIYTLPTGCSDTLIITASPKPNAGVDQMLCMSNGAASYVHVCSSVAGGTWTAMAGNPGTANIVTPNVTCTDINTFSTAGTYSFIYTTAAGCKDTVQVTAYTPATIGNYVWYDVNKDGLQNEPVSNGINGIKVYLYKETTPGVFVKVDSTITANNPANGNPGYYNFDICQMGNYKVQFPTSSGSYYLTPITNPSTTVDGNSDANTNTGFSGVIAIDPVNGTGLIKNNPTIDAGYYCDCNGFMASIVMNKTYDCLQGNSFTFSANINRNGGSYSYFWDFGDGTTSTSANPTHSYAAAGEYDVKLTVVENGFCACRYEASARQVYVGPQPKVNFDWQYNGNCLTYDFNSISTVSMGWITGFYWDFGNGQTSTQSNPLATFAAAGTYNVKLVVTTNYGCKDSIVFPVNIINKCTNPGGNGTGSTSNPCPSIGAITGNTVLCVGGTTTLADTTAGGTWASSNTAVATISNAGVVTAVSTGSTTITYTVVRPCGTVVSSVTVNVSSNSAQAITGIDSVCVGSTIYLSNANGGGTYTVSNANATVSGNGITGVTAGNVTVTYTITTPCGTFTSTKLIRVVVCPAPVTCNASWWQQPATNNCDSTLRFNVSTPSAGATYTWSFGDGSTGTGTPAVHKYATTGSFTVKLVVTNGTCKDSVSYNVYVSSCNVTSGGGGGVESKTLGDVIAQRLYGNAKSSTTEVNGIINNQPFTAPIVHLDGIDAINLGMLVPQTVAGTNKALISTPQDLTNFTNAVEVLAIDYANNNSIKAVAFGTKTYGDVYSHTKPICDRLKGAQLLEVKTIAVGSYNLTAYKVQQCTGEVEYAMNLSAGINNNDNNISLQSKWFTSSYAASGTMYNFQLWAVSYEMVKTMAQDIIAKLQANGNVTQAITTNDLPTAYITTGSRNKGTVTLNVQNNTTATTAIVELKEKATETATETTRQVPVTIQPNANSTVTIDVKDSYEATMNLMINNAKADMVYLNDGTWSKDYDAAKTTINNFTVTNEGTVANNNDEYRLLRNINFSATTSDYVTAYKTIGTKCQALDLGNYNALKFNANATGASSVTVTLISNNITDWKEQYAKTISLNGNQEYAINLSDFISSKYNTPINASNNNTITGVSFAFNNGRGVTSTMTASLSNARFGKGAVATTSDVQVGVYPNPSKGMFTLSFSKALTQQTTIKVIDVLGKQVGEVVTMRAGEQQKQINLQSQLSNGVYMVVIANGDNNFTPVKLVVNR